MGKIRKLAGFALALAFTMAMLPAMAFAETGLRWESWTKTILCC